MFVAHVRTGVDLRLLEERHAPTVFSLVHRERERLREWLPWVDSTRSEDDTRAFIQRSLEQFASNNGLAAGIWEHERLAGVIGMQPIQWLDRKTQIGYWLGREFEGRGLMTDASRAVTRHALVELGLNRVEILCATANKKSGAVPRRLGFTCEGVLREAICVNGHFFDAEVHAMLRRELK